MVFERDPFLVNICNKKLETPLHYAAKIGNERLIHCLIQLYPEIIKHALRKINDNGDTALHLAAKNGHEGVVHELMQFDPELAYLLNKEGLSPFYIAIAERCTSLVKTMLTTDGTLACTQDSNGMFPVHAAARMGSTDLIMHFMQKYPDDAGMVDHHGKNFFHIAAEENKAEVFTEVFESTNNTAVSAVIANMINATDYEGNTPLHSAAIKGHKSVMKAITENVTSDEEGVKNNQGLTPFYSSVNQVVKNTTKVCLS